MKPLLALFFALFLAGCVYDSTTECPTGVQVRLWAQTACAAEPTYPEVTVVRFFAFGEDGLLAATIDDVGAVLGENYRLPVTLVPGTYSVVVWARLGTGGYDVITPVIGQTTRQSLILKLRSQAGKLEGVDGMRLWTGAADNVVVTEHQMADVAINLHEETNRISVEVDGFTSPDDLALEVQTKTSAMRYSAAVEDGDDLTLDGHRTQDGNVVFDLFTVLQLGATQPRDIPVRAIGSRTLIVTDTWDGKVLFSGDLITELLNKNPAVNLSCTNDFAVRFVVGELPDRTHVIFEIWVNEWLVHSYENEL